MRLITAMNLCPCVVWCVGRLLSFDERCDVIGLRLALSAKPRRGACVGVNFGCAWLTLEQTRVPGLRADADAVGTASACTGAARRWCSCASLRGF